MNQARRAFRNHQPAAVILDAPSWGEDRWTLLGEWKRESSSVPVIVAGTENERAIALSFGADSHAVKPVAGEWLLQQLEHATGRSNAKTVLLIDDEHIARYLVRQTLNGIPLNFIEAANGERGLELAIEKQPDLIFLDLGLPGMSGLEVLEGLKEDARVSEIPVVIVTSQLLRPDESHRINQSAIAVVSKADLGGGETSERLQALLMRSGTAALAEERA